MHRIRVRVTLAATGAAILIGALGSALFLATLQENLQTALHDSASSQIEAVGAQLKAGETPAEAVVVGRDDVVLQIIGADGKVLASNESSLHRTPLMDQVGTRQHQRLKGFHDHYLLVADRVATGDLVVVGRSDEQVGRATSLVAILLAVSVPIGLGLVALAIFVAVGRALRPVEQMRREAGQITSEHLHRRLAVPPGDDEIPALAQTLNAMLDRIDASHRLQKQFVSDASHELRSPLASLRQIAEVARRYPDAHDVSGLADDVFAEEQRMEGLVEALLLLARPDPEAGSTACDLDDVVFATARRVGGVDIFEVGAAQVAGDPVLWSQAIGNLVANARRHATSQVKVTLHAEGTDAVLHVDDDGSGVPAEERERIFDRFVRLDESRARDGGGSGLGLSIVHKIVTAYDGRVLVTDSPLGGARFSVVVPLLEPALSEE